MTGISVVAGITGFLTIMAWLVFRYIRSKLA